MTLSGRERAGGRTSRTNRRSVRERFTSFLASSDEKLGDVRVLVLVRFNVVWVIAALERRSGGDHDGEDAGKE
jgi:hypothetical protein